jgi:hypothetical protein
MPIVHADPEADLRVTVAALTDVLGLTTARVRDLETARELDRVALDALSDQVRKLRRRVTVLEGGAA